MSDQIRLEKELGSGNRSAAETEAVNRSAVCKVERSGHVSYDADEDE